MFQVLHQLLRSSIRQQKTRHEFSQFHSPKSEFGFSAWRFGSALLVRRLLPVFRGITSSTFRDRARHLSRESIRIRFRFGLGVAWLAVSPASEPGNGGGHNALSEARRLRLRGRRPPWFLRRSRRWRHGWLLRAQPTSSIAKAIPWPPPIHMVAIPRASPSRRIE